MDVASLITENILSKYHVDIGDPSASFGSCAIIKIVPEEDYHYTIIILSLWCLYYHCGVSENS